MLRRPSALVQAAAVARRYYVAEATNIEIAEEFGISRFTVARILDEARASGLVHIEVPLPTHINAVLSNALRVRSRLNHPIVLTTAEEAESSLRGPLAVAAANLLVELVTESDVIGVGLGRTIGAVVATRPTLPRCDIVQLSGVLSTDIDGNSSVELVRTLASIVDGPLFALYAPMIVADAATKDGLSRQPQVATTLARYLPSTARTAASVIAVRFRAVWCSRATMYA